MGPKSFVQCVLLTLTISQYGDATFEDTFQEMQMIFKRLLAKSNVEFLSNAQCREDMKFWNRSLSLFIDASNTACNATDTDCITNQAAALNENMFAAKQLDSFGRIPPNLLGLTSLWMGSWEECLDVRAPIRQHYQTHFCHISLTSKKLLSSWANLTMLKIDKNEDFCKTMYVAQWTVCAPRSCRNKDLDEMIAEVNKQENVLGVKFCKATCRAPHRPKKGIGFWIVITYCSLGAVLVVVGSFYDYYTERDENQKYREIKGAKYLLAFSMYTNGAAILNTTKKPGQIYSIHSIRTLSMSWIICGHCFAIFILGDNPAEMLQLPKKWINTGILNGFAAVDSFFFLSGLLVGYLFYRQIDKNPRNILRPQFWFCYYAHRYLRLSPPYFLFLVVQIFIYEHMITGPFPLETLKVQDFEDCKRDWWRNVLYINKMYDNKGECMGHSWYLSADMQMYIFAPIILIPLFYSLTGAGFIAAALCIASGLANYMAYYKYNFPATFFGFFTGILNDKRVPIFEHLIYKAFWIRFTPYLCGIFTGYFLHRTRGKKLHLHWMLVVAMWLLTFGCLYAVLYSLYDYMQGHDLSTFSKATYNYWSKFAWSLALAWIVIACEHGWAGPLKTFLEFGFWAPFSRLSYSAYLIHVLAVAGLLSGGRQSLHFIGIFKAYIRQFTSVFAFIYACAFVWSCTFEIPLSKIEIMLTAGIGGDRQQEKKEPKDERQINGIDGPRVADGNTENCFSRKKSPKY